MKRWLTDYKKNIGTGLGVVFAFVIVLGVANKQAGHQTRQQAASAAASKKVDVLGDVYQTKDYSIVINRIESYPVEEATGTKRYQAEVSISNASGDTLQIAPGLQMFLSDRDGSVYSATARYLSSGVVIGGPVASGASSNVTVDFDLPASAVADTFLFYRDSSSEAQVIEL